MADLMAALKASVEAARSERRRRRVSELSRMSKAQLVTVWHSTHGANVIWTVRAVERWSKDELITDILAAEFPS